jgi:nucleoside-diphosphate-sugar epimerase
VLVTGAGGFIGRHLVKRLLVRVNALRLFVRREPDAEVLHDPRVEIVLGDLGDPEPSSARCWALTFVYHLGAAMRGRGADFSAARLLVTQRGGQHADARHEEVSLPQFVECAARRRGK